MTQKKHNNQKAARGGKAIPVTTNGKMEGLCSRLGERPSPRLWQLRAPLDHRTGGMWFVCANPSSPSRPPRPWRHNLLPRHREP